MEHKINMVIAGIAKDTHEKFPIRYDVSETGNPYFIGCTIEAKITTSKGSTFTKRMNIRAFGDQADELAHITEGSELEVLCSYDMQKSERDGKYYPIGTVLEVISA
jgi:hypothetical protein